MDYKQLLRYFLAGKARLPPPRQQQVRFSAAKLRKKSFTTPFVMSILQKGTMLPSKRTRQRFLRAI